MTLLSKSDMCGAMQACRCAQAKLYASVYDPSAAIPCRRWEICSCRDASKMWTMYIAYFLVLVCQVTILGCDAASPDAPRSRHGRQMTAVAASRKGHFAVESFSGKTAQHGE